VNMIRAPPSSSSPLKRSAKEAQTDEIDDDAQEVSSSATKDFNARGMVVGDVVVHRAPVMKFLSAPRSFVTQPFRPPFPSGWKMPAAEAGLGRLVSGRRSLGMTRKRPPSGVKSTFKAVSLSASADGSARETFTDVEDDLYKKYLLDPVVLYEGADGHRVTVEPVIGKYLREHQREGLQFLFECVAGLRPFGGCGCILADDMGLGKTLQSITLIYTVLRQGLEKDKPLAKRVIVVVPTSLVRNWDNEIDKWLKGRVRCLAIAESSRKEIEKQIRAFTTTRMYDVLVLSYEVYRLNCKMFEAENAGDLLICDEAHRLKNDATQTSIALDKLHTKRRVLLSGTPMQNDLEEFFAMVNFCNPGVLGTVSQFRRKYQQPMLIGREPDASDEEIKKSTECSNELSDIVNQFILRRTNSLLSKHLPPKLTQIVCINLTEMQKLMYNHLVFAKEAYSSEKEKKSSVVSAQSLGSINALKKLCNHPQLLYQQDSKYKLTKDRSKSAYGLEDINQFFPDNFGVGGGSARRSFRGEPANWGPNMSMSNCEWSGKFLVCRRLLQAMRHETDDRMVIVSNYTQTLDVMEIMCTENNFPFVRLDGSASIKKRQAMVDRLNDPNDDVFIFLLSSKAGGCGLNLIGANRLILFDPDWNPATDKQAAARVWRDGQKKRTYVYRFLATGTIEEKVYQRQLSKEGLQSVVADEQNLESAISSGDLKDLFRLREDTVSDTHDKFLCKKCTFTGLEQPPIEDMVFEKDEVPVAETESSGGSGRGRFRVRSRGGSKRRKPTFTNPPATVPPDLEQEGLPNEGDLNEWSHHYGCESVDDALLRKAGRGLVSFCFGQAIDGDSLAMKAEMDAAKLASAVEAAKSGALKTESDDGSSATRALADGATNNTSKGTSIQINSENPQEANGETETKEEEDVDRKNVKNDSSGKDEVEEESEDEDDDDDDGEEDGDDDDEDDDDEDDDDEDDESEVE